MNEIKKYENDRISNLQERREYSFIRDNMVNFPFSTSREPRREGNIHYQEYKESSETKRKSVSNYSV